MTDQTPSESIRFRSIMTEMKRGKVNKKVVKVTLY